MLALSQMRSSARDAARLREEASSLQPADGAPVSAAGAQESRRVPAPSTLPPVDDGTTGRLYLAPRGTMFCKAQGKTQTTTTCVCTGKFAALIDRVQQQLDALEADLSSSRDIDPWAIIRQRMRDAGSGGPPRGPRDPPSGGGGGEEPSDDDDSDGGTGAPADFSSSGPIDVFARTLGAARSFASPRRPAPLSPVR